MEQVNSDKIYILGSKANNVESVIVTDQEKLSIMGFDTFDSAKSAFKIAYDILLAPSFTPSRPPSEEELNYHMEFMRLITFYPVIIELNRKDGSGILVEWKDFSAPLFQTAEKFYEHEYWHCPMREGFLKKYGVLDIAKDIETTPFVGPNGKMVVRINDISFGSHQEKEGGKLSEKEIDELLREKGVFIILKVGVSSVDFQMTNQRFNSLLRQHFIEGSGFSLITEEQVKKSRSEN